VILASEKVLDVLELPGSGSSSNKGRESNACQVTELRTWLDLLPSCYNIKVFL
jgi:hypothetical protein